MPEIALNPSSPPRVTFVVGRSVEQTGHIDWTFVPNTPGALWGRPYGHLYLSQPDDRDMVENAMLESIRQVTGKTQPVSGIWQLSVYGIETRHCYGGGGESIDWQFASDDQGEFGRRISNLLEGVILISAADMERLRPELDNPYSSYIKYAVINLPATIKTRGNPGLVLDTTA